MIIRNIMRGKLCNGTRVILVKPERHLLICKIATGAGRGETVYLPRVSLEPSAGDSIGLLFSRRQFPVKPAYAITINKSQGQSLNTVGLYLWDSVFSHGQLYVALSRASSFEGVHIVAHKSTKHNNRFTTRNVVYKEVLQKVAAKIAN